MLKTYTKLQKKQLLDQQAVCANGLCLLLAAPARCSALRESLPRQLHPSYRLTDRLDRAVLTPVFDGVFLAAEDVSLTSTALSSLAQALAEGADFVTCDALYGYAGTTACYRPTGQPQGCRCALLSRELAERCLDEAVSANLSELLFLAAAKAEQPRHLPLALLHYARELQAEDVFSSGNGPRRAVVLTHEYNMTGAPIVLVSAIPVLRKLGFEVVVMGPSDNGSLALFVNAGAIAVSNRDCVAPSPLWSLPLSADFILANTIVEVEIIRMLSGSSIPVLWWLHDAFAGYAGLGHRIPESFDANIHLCAVGSHATAALHSIRPEMEVQQLIYGLPDYAAEKFGSFDISFAGGRLLFVTVGSIEQRKGPDILTEAIRLLPDTLREKAAFLFVGGASDSSLFKEITDLCADYPQNAFYRKRLTRDEIKSLMTQCDCVVCSSRDDPMPTFITEGLIFSKPFIVSEHTGTAGLTTEGVDGFVYRDDSPEQLAERLAYAIEHPEQLRTMRPACRALFERHFSKEAFEHTLSRYVTEIMQEAEEHTTVS